MRHLVRLVTPQAGTVLDLFAGSGTTLIAAEMEGFAWIGVEREADYVAIIEARLQGVQRGLGLDVPAPTPPMAKTGGVIIRQKPQGADVGMYSPGVRPAGEVVGYADGYRPTRRPEQPEAESLPAFDVEPV